MKFIFLGTSEFGAVILEKLIKNNYKPFLVITALDKPVGRKQIITPPPVKISAEKHDIPVLQPEILANYKLQIANYKPDLIIVAAYGQILPKEILAIPKFGCLNIHPSLLPKYRGPSPIQAAILNGDKETGVSIFLMDEKIDRGKIISNSRFLISDEKIIYPELLKKLAEKGADLLIKTISKWLKNEIKPKPQNESEATYTKILKKDDGKIDWRKSAEKIERQIRAFNPWPGTFTRVIQNTKILKILEAEICQCEIDPMVSNFKKRQIGKIFLIKDKKMSVHLAIQCKKDCLIVKKLQIEGKKPLRTEEFLKGNRNLIIT